MTGKIIILSGPSGVGKGTVVRELLARYPSLSLSVSATTRSPRPGEVDGREYFFLSQEAFDQKIERGEMLEYARYVNHSYGTPAGPVREKLEKGCGVILEIEIQGARHVMQRVPDAVSIFLLPPSTATLLERLRGRGTETEEVIRQRSERALEELEAAGEYRYRVVNDHLPDTVRLIAEILKKEKASKDFR